MNRPAEHRLQMNHTASSIDSNATGLVTLPGECVLSDIETLRQQLLAAQQLTQPVTLDVGAIERIDTASMQLILTFVLDRAVSERRLTISGSSPAWDEATNILGCSRLLQVAA